MISVRTHNVFDYCLGAAFLLSPYVFGFSRMYFAHDVFMVLGFAVLGYSYLTDYTHSWFKAVPFGMHMTFDAITGAFVILAPWVYGYWAELTPGQSAIHWSLGLAEFASVALTERAARPATRLLKHEALKHEAAEKPRPRKAA